MIIKIQAVASVRSYTTAPTASKSKLPYIFLGVGVASAAGYVYLDRAAPAPIKPKQEKSLLDPQNFVDFKLKKIIPYNHNSARLVFPSFPKFPADT